MPNLRHDDNRLVETEAALELLRQIKEDTVSMILNLQEAARNRETPKSRRPRDGGSWMAPQANQVSMNNADD